MSNGKPGRPRKRGADNVSTIDTSVRSHFESLFRPHKLRFKKPETVYRYRLELDRFDKFLERPAMLPDLTDVVVGDAAEWVMAAKPGGLGLSVESTRGFLGRIKKIWDFLARKRIVDEFPTLENLRKQKCIPRAWTRHELSLLWQAIKRQPGDLGGIPTADWFCSFLVVMWRTSERPGALLQTRPEDVDQAGYLTIPAERRKGGRIGRVYKLTPDCLEWLARIREPANRELLWPWPYGYEYLWARYKEILRCAGLPCDRSRMFGCVRKSHASHLEAAGGDATSSLGHSSRETTTDHYLDERIVRSDWPADRLFGLGDEPEPPRVA